APFVAAAFIPHGICASQVAGHQAACAFLRIQPHPIDSSLRLITGRADEFVNNISVFQATGALLPA
ncbi:MAG: hypothetical protein FWD68_13545, partial [Alphaproteobacteria bacterium]|nr:hypothetical protein [Alphaproteobacteria bacterium]